MAFIFQKVGRGVNEFFVIAKNGEADARAGGEAMCWDYTTDSDGITVIEPTTAGLGFFAGVVAHGKTLAASGTDGQYGKLQIYGHHAGIYMGIAGATAVKGNPLVPSNLTGSMVVATTHTASTVEACNVHHIFAWAAANAAGSLFTRTAGMIRAM